MHTNIGIHKKVSQNPRHAWNAIFLLTIITILSSLVGGAKPLIIYILTSFLVGIFLFKRHPTIYLSFAIWMYFLSPLISRLHSYRVGGELLPGNAAAAPLVASISIFTFIKYLPKIIKNRDQIGLGFTLCLGSILYAILLRWILNPTPQSIQKELGLPMSFTGPVLLGFYLYINWHNYPLFRNILQKTFLWIAIVIGSYGILQFLFAPGWDSTYIIANAGEQGSWIGKPEPFGIRVFSTMGDPFSFSLNLMSSLVLLNISSLNILGYIASGVGYSSFLLSTSRTAWYSLVVAMFFLITSQKSSRQIKIFLIVAIIGIIVVPLCFIEPFSSLISQRLSTFTNLGEDVSAQGRLDIFYKTINIAISEFIGKGIDDSSFREIMIDNDPSSKIEFSSMDTGYFQLLYSMGWLGTIPYLSGIALLVSKLFWKPLAQIDVFAAACRAIVLASIIRIATTSILLGDFALPLWIFMGAGIASYKYHKDQIASSNLRQDPKIFRD